MDTLQKAGEEIRWHLHPPSNESSKSKSWKRHPTVAQIYGKLPRVSTLVKSRRIQFSGHCFRADSEIISSLLLWKPTFDHTRGRKLSFPDVISRDTGIRTQDLGTVMKDREVWRSIVDSMLSTAVD